MKSLSFAIAICAAALAPTAFGATAPAPSPSPSNDPGSLLPGGNSKEPVSIEADQLVYSDKEGKATYTGNVVLIQSPTKLNCSVMVLYIDKSNSTPTPAPGGAPKPAATPSPAPGAQGASSSSQVRHMDCSGPVTVVSKTQTATGDSAVYDKPQNKIWLIGNVTLSDGPNVTKGDKLTYDLLTGQAHVETKNGPGKTGRVWSQFVPGSDNNSASAEPTPGASPAKPGAKPAPAKTGATKP
jgi:lipopolysaccharide export system protein LptA